MELTMPPYKFPKVEGSITRFCPNIIFPFPLIQSTIIAWIVPFLEFFSEVGGQ